MAKRKSKNLSKKCEGREKGCIETCLFKLLNGVPAALVLLLIIFVWSSSTTIISSSIVHVCVTSRKVGSLYCLSAGAHEPNNYDLPFPAISNSSKIAVVGRGTKSVLNETTKPALQIIKTSAIEEMSKEVVKITPNYTISSPVIASVTLTTVARDNIAIQLPVSRESKTSQLSDGSTKEASSFIKLTLPKGIDKAKAEEILNARKDVEGQIATLRTYIAKSKPSDCEKRGIYVYDLPPKFNKDLLAMCEEVTPEFEFCKYLSNDVMGDAIPELGEGWYNTHQYSLEPIFHNRILNHPCRVHNPEEAKLFYVPFYGGLDVLRWHFKKVSNEVKDSLSNELVQWLDKQWMWKRNFGLDHVFVLGKISWDFRRPDNGSWGSHLLELEELQNPMKLLIERQPWEINDVGVPHPTYFHPSSDDDITAWQENLRQMQRKYLISFAGAPRKASDSIRSILIKQCTSSPNDCNFFNCAEKPCVKSSSVVKLFMDSEFCLQPPGDSPTRKSVFDSLIAGCIPVIFNPFTAYYQYPWHLPKDHRKFSVFIDQEEVKFSQVNVVEQLVKIPLSRRQEMRRYIIDELMPKLVYAQANAKLEKYQDAFTISVNNLLQRAASRLL